MDYSFNLSSKQIFNSKKSLELLLIPSFQKIGKFFRNIGLPAPSQLQNKLRTKRLKKQYNIRQK